jgi:hypothetical protein
MCNCSSFKDTYVRQFAEVKLITKSKRDLQGPRLIREKMVVYGTMRMLPLTLTLFLRANTRTRFGGGGGGRATKKERERHAKFWYKGV